MSIINLTGWSLTAAGFLGLVFASYRGASPTIRMIFALIATAGLVVLFTGRGLALPFYVLDVALVFGTWRISRTRFWQAWIILIILLLIVSKLPGALSAAGVKDAADLPLIFWIGFSYLAFRLIHTTYEAHNNRLGDPTLPEFVIYALHPASFVSGPIDRIRPNVASQRKESPFTEDLHQGLWRILIGAFRKFVLANPLFAFIAQHDMTRNPDLPIHIAWLWLIAYSFYLWLDFSSYTDLAIGFGRLAGITLPENFDRPYLSPSLSLFWQRWHITLSTWVRDYIFFPIVRALRTRAGNRFRNTIQFIAHMTTMGAVGLWHGLTPAFLLWGLWHGFGLFAHGQIAAHVPKANPQPTFQSRLRTVISVLATYLFVTLGWVLFTADLPTAVRIYARLFGIQ
jgi:alginate O-acetyltransferase complex protein AlgI